MTACLPHIRLLEDEMWRLLLSFAIVLGTADCACPRGFDLMADGQCRGFVGRVVQPWEAGAINAVQKCSEIPAGDAVSIHNQEQQSYWQSKAPAANDGLLVLGLVCNKITEKWVWVDGSAVDFKPPYNAYNSDLDIPCSLDVTWYIQPGGYWSYGALGSKMQAYIFCTATVDE